MGAVQGILIVALAIYLAMTSWLYLNQRKLIFFPSPLGSETPLDYGTPYEDIYFKTADDIELHGWWVPQLNNEKQKVSLLYCHGNGATLSMLSHVTSIFHSYGVDTFLFDYRAYGASKGAHHDLTEANLHLDARATLAWLKEKRPDQPIVVWGHSLGAAVASRLSHSVKVDGLILEGAFSSVPEMARHRYPFVPIVERLLHSPFKTIEYVQKRHDAPLLMIHTERDSVIPIALGKRTFDAAPEPKEWLLVVDADHNEFPDVHELYRDRVVHWLNARLPK